MLHVLKKAEKDILMMVVPNERQIEKKYAIFSSGKRKMSSQIKPSLGVIEGLSCVIWLLGR